MENHSRKECSLLGNSSGHLHCHSCSVSILLSNQLTVLDPYTPSPVPSLLTLNLGWKQGHNRGLGVWALGTILSAILDFRRTHKELTSVILASLGPGLFLYNKDLDTGKYIQNSSQELSSMGGSSRGITSGKAWDLQAHSACGLLNYKCAVWARFFL